MRLRIGIVVLAALTMLIAVPACFMLGVRFFLAFVFQGDPRDATGGDGMAMFFFGGLFCLVAAAAVIAISCRALSKKTV